jgi:cysteine desulfurase/selenocysteine lyase
MITDVRLSERKADEERVAAIRRDFPIFDRVVPSGHRLVYLDSAASAQKPSVMLDRMNRFYREEYANIHRGVYPLA